MNVMSIMSNNSSNKKKYLYIVFVSLCNHIYQFLENTSFILNLFSASVLFIYSFCFFFGGWGVGGSSITKQFKKTFTSSDAQGKNETH